MVKKWEIYYVNLDPSMGSEQKGTRPVMVLSNDGVNANLPVFTCAPFSSVKSGSKIYPTEIYFSATESGLPKDSVLMLQQIRTVSNTRIRGNKVNEITDSQIKSKIDEYLKIYFDLN